MTASKTGRTESIAERDGNSYKPGVVQDQWPKESLRKEIARNISYSLRVFTDFHNNSIKNMAEGSSVLEMG